MNLRLLAASIHADAAILRAYAETGSIRGAARALGTTIHQVQRVVDPVATAEHIAKTTERNRSRLPAEWQGAACSICRTRPGRMYCAARCDGDHCGEEATAQRLADYERYNAQRRKNNARATREQRRIEPKRSEEAMNSERRAIG
ncbi:MAG: hypothetical protein WC565_06925 [Parcubacteria group bacterium]